MNGYFKVSLESIDTFERFMLFKLRIKTFNIEMFIKKCHRHFFFAYKHNINNRYK